MKFRFITAFLLGVSLFFSGCASSSSQNRQLTSEESDNTEILGSVQTSFVLTGRLTIGMLSIPPSDDSIKRQAYLKLLEEARKKYPGEGIDIQDINVSQGNRQTNSIDYEYSYTATGNVVSTYSSLARTANRLEGITNQILNTFRGNQDITLAIFDFVNVNGRNSILGRYLVEQISNFFFQNSDLRIVERSQIDRILNEQNFGMSGYVNDESAARIGHMLGANAVAIGTLTRVGNRISVNIKVVDAESASLLSSGSTEIEGSEYIEMYNEYL